MTKEWLKIMFASVFEVMWVIGLKHADSFLEWSITTIAIFISFYFMIVATKHLPVGTVYAVFVGLGTTGTVLVDILIFGTSVTFTKFAFIALILAGVVGLKLAATHGETQRTEEVNE